MWSLSPSKRHASSRARVAVWAPAVATLTLQLAGTTDISHPATPHCHTAPLPPRFSTPPPTQVAPVLANTAQTASGGGESAKSSFARSRTFLAQCEAAINEQINIE